MKLAIAKLPEFWRGITRNRDIERSAREWMEGYDAALAYCAEQLDQALSHAAGQDGEQCRAASVASGDVTLAVIQSACDEYARVGMEQAGESEYFADAMEAAIKAALRALSRGVPEGMVLVPRASAEMAAVVCEEWGELFVGTPGLDKYERFNYGPAVEMLRDELRAIAAQRKGGEKAQLHGDDYPTRADEARAEWNGRQIKR